ncbi:aldehyde dehydrogenase (NADP(+)) [Amycolatopsis sp. DSM 110486]|uniref:aldehyde dehydrogenase (NADP(+)) n=1 Tax=Amycolatopsis sp. DSM 110486 TaxID=2865832 RepID=UPI001C69D04A|nr:aldehyde dehydrogenase (NADP(+)) [Amycolatopsis sp. DSM 110486]QYN19350.1 aldehyde dehydrogenase (NADP(+)) [Amycolatopsis sp. DSM 110486]
MTTLENRPVAGVDPWTGEALEAGAVENSAEEVRAIVAEAAAAAPRLEALGRRGRAKLLRALAQALEAERQQIVSLADAETALGAPRLGGELTRTCYQLEFFAGVVEDGGYVEATLDPAGPTPMGPRPDLRRMLVPIGPVAVFGASNFPLAFSVPGGDTASALAAGNPVVVKAHGSHPGTSRLVHEVLREALVAAGAPAGALGLVFGRAAGESLVTDPTVKAVGFTGSLSGGRALLDLIRGRAEPIPFYGELSSLNPLVVTAAAARETGAEIGVGLVASVTGSAGQLCTKPGLVLVPAGTDGDAVVAAAAEALGKAEVVPLLNRRIHQAYLSDTAGLVRAKEVSEVASGPKPGGGYGVAPLLTTVDADGIPAEAFAEYFGPAAVIVRYRSQAELLAVVDQAPASLTATLHLGADEAPKDLVTELSRRVGRLVFNGYPTGVAVSWAQHHGGPWPATNSLHTSVGATAIRRFLRPLAWQNAPAHLLPDELTDEPRAPLPRRIDGRLQARH